MTPALDLSPNPARLPNGRFVPGVSGNPAGRPCGSRNKASLLREALEEGEGAVLARQILDDARDGDKVALRFCMGRLERAPRGRPVPFELASHEAGNVRLVFNRVTMLLAEGEITPEEAYWIGRYLALKKALPWHSPSDDAAEGIEEEYEEEEEEEVDEEETATEVLADPSSPSPALAQAELALPRQAKAALPPRACGRGTGRGDDACRSAAGQAPAASFAPPASPACGGGESGETPPLFFRLAAPREDAAASGAPADRLYFPGGQAGAAGAEALPGAAG
jgi:hypothetical protein